MRRDTLELARGSLFIEKIKKTFEAADVDLLTRVYAFSEAKAAGPGREPFQAAELLLDQKSDAITISGALLGPLVWHGKAELSEIMDRVGLRIIVASVPECYSIPGLLHTHFKPIPGTFDDDIGLPKDNGCQSLHTCVYPVRENSHKPIETQIHTDIKILPGTPLRVNGKNAGPDYQFRDGDTIEIMENGNHATTN